MTATGGFASEFVDEVRRTAGIVPIISDHVHLKKAGKGWKGLCPFHREKTPSFTVDEEKGLYYCFGCGTGGDAFRFLMQMEGVTFPQAVRQLAERFGLRIPERKEAEDPERDMLLRAQAEAMAFYRTVLWGREGEGARRYMAARGISDETARRFELGFAPARWDGLLKGISRGFRPEELERAGLALRRQDGKGHYDRFRGRLIFPILDSGGRPVGFGGRIFEAGGSTAGARGDREEPKYLNSPETPIYRKGTLLYALPAARRGIREEGAAILVEGYMDAIALHQHGFTSAVAVLGTAFTTDQARLLGRFCRRVFVNFDADEAGARAGGRSLDLLLEEGLEIRVVRLAAGDDPDSLLRRDGAEAYRIALQRSRNYLDDLIEEAASKADLSNPTGKVDVLNQVLPFLARVEDRVVRSEYASRLGERLSIADAVILDALKKVLFAGKSSIALPAGAKTADGPAPDERILVRALLDLPELRRELLDGIVAGMVSPESAVVLRALEGIDGRVDLAVLSARISDDRARVLLARLAAEGEPADAGAAREVHRRMTKKIQERRKAELTKRMEAAQRVGDLPTLERLQQEKMALLRGTGGKGPGHP